MSGVRSAATARHTVTPHLVVRGAGAASEWYQRALGAEERGRVGPRPAPPRRPGRRDQGGGSGDVRRQPDLTLAKGGCISEGNVMAGFGMVGKLVARPGRRGELVDLLMDATRELQGADGCELYVVSQDRDDLDTIWVFEAWRDEAAHHASLAMPAVRGVIERGLPLIAERDGARLEPVGGVGLIRS